MSREWLTELLKTDPSLGVPHFTTADDIYKGMYIPKGATVFSNVRCVSPLLPCVFIMLMRGISSAMAWDETVYRDPHGFRPERFMGPDAEPLPVEFAFGFGRRYVTFVCVQ